MFVKTLHRTLKFCPRSHFRTKLQSANMAFFVGSSAIYLSIFPLRPNVTPFYNEVQTKNDSFERFMHTLFVLNVTFMY